MSLLNSKDVLPSHEVEVTDSLAQKYYSKHLPLDILHHLFTLGHHLAEESDGDGDDFALQVSHVCRHWRDVAVHIPRLWSHIIFDPEDTIYGFQRQRQWIERSRNTPIEIWIGGDPVEEGDPWNGASVSIMKEIRAMVAPEASRWVWLEVLEVPLDAIEVLFQGLQDVSASCLERLNVQRTTALGGPPAGWTFQAFGSTPKLKFADFADLPVDLKSPVFHTSGLQSICFSDLSFSPNPHTAAIELLNVIKGLESLRVLEMEKDQAWVEVEPDEGPQILGEPFIHANLNSIINVHHTLLNRLLPLIKTPALLDLTDISFDAYPTLCNLNPPPNLRRLGIENNMALDLDEHGLLSGLFDLFPHLTNLELAGFDFVTHDSFQLLSTRLPKLQVLQLCVCLGLTESRVRDLVQSRIGQTDVGTTRLTDLTIVGRGVTVAEGMENWDASLSPLVEKVDVIVY